MDNSRKKLAKLIQLLLILSLIGCMLLTCFSCTPNDGDDGDNDDNPADIVDDNTGNDEPDEPEEPFVYKYVVVLGADGAGNNHGGDSDAEKYVFLGIRGQTVAKTEISDCQTKDIACIIANALQIDPHENWTGKVPEGIFKVTEND